MNFLSSIDMKKSLYKITLVVFAITQISYVFLFRAPKIVDTASLTTASATLGNSRMSYKAGISASPETSGATTISIDTAGSEADEDTDHLFPGDTFCVTNDVESGCRGASAFTGIIHTVNTIVDSDTFTFTPATTTNLAAGDYVVATQSGSLTVTFTTANTIPSNGNLLLTIPAVNVNNKTNDTFPDTSTASGSDGTATNGFDLNGIAAADITTTGCTDGDWVTTETITAGTASTDHTIEVSRQNSSCTAGSTVTITIDSSPGLINPAPIINSTNQGTADIYTLNVKSRNSSDDTLDEVDIDVAPIEGVLVSTTVDETLSFTVAGVSSSSSTCGITTDITTTAMSVPFGTLAAADTFYDGSQLLTLSTNADNGYAVTIEENDQMGRNGNTCTGATAGEADNCIEDTTCDGGSCTHTTSAEWTTATNNGLGYSLANSSGTDASFLYNESARTFSTKQLPDREVPETKTNIMSNGSPVSASAIYVCYRLSISATQPAGYYYNKVKYTATAVF